MRRATAAATITFITSAKMNGANPNATARCQLPVTIASQETRVWQRQDGRWKHVHFHRSTSK